MNARLPSSKSRPHNATQWNMTYVCIMIPVSCFLLEEAKFALCWMRLVRPPAGLPIPSSGVRTPFCPPTP